MLLRFFVLLPLILRLYRIDVGVKDDSEATRFIIFEEEAEKTIGQSAMSVYDIEDKKEGNELEGDLPALIANIIGRRYVFRVKLTEYNKTAYKQSFTATKVFPESYLGNDDKSQKCGNASRSGVKDSMDVSPK
ncbi:hypothetical protein DM860_006444 [Cuscuta australis]|uniref:Replication factor A C-terminal domain-containing protein n=1 Tax=Cuscuta australis TaxID=267555 RepID=A0A328D4N7_9ASTE|nr:hypothetical protein DM860_006444 [Cuscuta australis]